jgi:hypothetical protein
MLVTHDPSDTLTVKFSVMHNGDTDGSVEIDAAVLAGTTPFLNGRRVQLAQVAVFYGLPAIYAGREYVEVGGLRRNLLRSSTEARLENVGTLAH